MRHGLCLLASSLAILQLWRICVLLLKPFSALDCLGNSAFIHCALLEGVLGWAILSFGAAYVIGLQGCRPPLVKFSEAAKNIYTVFPPLCCLVFLAFI